jgi:hypothetical protein
MMVGESKKLSERSSQEKIPAITINSTLVVQHTAGHAIQGQY